MLQLQIYVKGNAAVVEAVSMIYDAFRNKLDCESRTYTNPSMEEFFAWVYFSLFVFLSVCLSVCLSISSSVFLFSL